jgi:predicted nucleotidyltransferase
MQGPNSSPLLPSTGRLAYIRCIRSNAAMRPSEVLDRNREAIREATTRFNAANPRVFGSVARGEDGPQSDIDILVDALPGSTLFSLGGLQYELEQMFGGIKVDLLTPGDLPQQIRARILAEAKPL